jgi:hypothetical protein
MHGLAEFGYSPAARGDPILYITSAQHRQPCHIIDHVWWAFIAAASSKHIKRI